MKSKNLILIVVLSLLIPFNLSAQKSEKKAAKTSTVKILTNMHCHTCKEKIESELTFQKGVKEVTADLATNIVTVVFNPKKNVPENFVSCLQNAGYQAKIYAESDGKQACPKSCEGHHEGQHEGQHDCQQGGHHHD